MLIEPEELERRAAELRGRLSDWEWGYLVDLIEGEGSLSIDYLKKTGRYYPKIRITNTNLKILSYFQSKLKIGRIYRLKHVEGWREGYQYHIRGVESLILLSVITKLLFSHNKNKAALLLALNKCNYGPYAEKIKSRIGYLTNKKEEENIINIKYSNELIIKNNIAEFELGLLAGLIDGEGNISIRKDLRQLMISIVSTSPQIINKILDVSRGWRLHIRKPRPSSWRTRYDLYIYNRDAKSFLEKIKDYLILKKDRAVIALKFAETLGQPGHRPPASIKKLREKLYWELRALNQRGTSRYGSAVLASASHIPRGIEWGLPRPLLSIDI